MLTIRNYGRQIGEVVDLPEATVAVMLADGRALPYVDDDGAPVLSFEDKMARVASESSGDVPPSPQDPALGPTPVPTAKKKVR